MPQNNYVEDAIKRNGRQLNYEVKVAKKAARAEAKKRILARKLRGMRAKQFIKKNKAENIKKKKEIKKKENINTIVTQQSGEALPHFLLDRNIQTKSAEKSQNVIKIKKSTVSKYAVPIPRVQGLPEGETFKPITTGKKRASQWKRMVTKAVFVGESFTRKNPKYERFIRPMGLRFKTACVVNPQTQTTHKLEILGVKKNPHSDLYTNLGLLTRGTIIEVNVDELGLVSSSGKIIWGKYAQITNNPENDGIINAILLV